MIKKFFISMLGAMAALWLSLLIFISGIILLVAKFAVDNMNISVSDKKVLHIELKGVIDEYPSSAQIADLLAYGNDSGEPFSNIMMAIKMAKTDKNVKGILLDCGGSELGVASRSEIMQALTDFRESGKWVYAYGDNYTQGDYYLASCADKVILNPVGAVDVHGLGAMVLYFEDVMKKLGIGIDVVKVGTFKSAVEPYIRMNMSEANRQQTSIYIDQIWSNITADIAENRGLASADTIACWANNMFMTLSPEQYKECNAVTDLMYRSEVEDMIRKNLSIKDSDKLPLVQVANYLTMNVADIPTKDDKHIAVLFAAGDITEDAEGGIASERMVPVIRELAEDKKVKGLVLRVNSGGGSAFASEQIWKALEDFKATGKPLYVSMGDYAASGGYYISCGADSIYCDASTLTGSIGIFGVLPNAQELLRNKIGLGCDTVTTGPDAVFPSMFYASTPRQLQAMQTYVERGYETFVGRVSQGRDIPVDSVKVIGEGRVWDGISALKIGLVDHIGGLENAISAMSVATGIDKDQVVYYPENEMKALDMLLSMSTSNVNINVCGMSLEQDAEYLQALRMIRNISPLQARMEKIIVR